MTNIDLSRRYDVLVIGGGNAALCAAITARTHGMSVLIVEAAPKAFRGGNSRHTRNIRTMHERPLDVLQDAYPEDEYWRDLVSVTGGLTNEMLARTAIRHSRDHIDWMKRYGVRLQAPLAGTLQLARTNAFFLGGGKALVNAYYAAAQSIGVEVIYETQATDLLFRDGRFSAAVVARNGATHEIRAHVAIVASGGFESNLGWLRAAWGPAADNFIVRGTPYNTGRMLKCLLDRGVKSVGDATQGHCVAIDARAPKFDGGIVTRVDAVSLGIVVNRNAQRFYDEGEDFWPKRYAIWGRLIAEQPDQIAFAIIDAKSIGKFMPPVYPPIKAATIAELAGLLDLDAATLARTIDAFNHAVRPGAFDHTKLDDCRTEGVDPPKTHWARRIDAAPFYAYPLRPGITFTYLGVAIDTRARVLLGDDTPIENLFAAGEIMAGNVLGKGYLAGIGMTIGTTFGRIAGEEAARHLQS